MNRINKFRRLYFSTILAMLIMILSGCNVIDDVVGGSSGNSNGTHVKITFDLSGFNDTAGAVDVSLSMPDGITIETDGDGNLTTGGFTGTVSDGYYHSKYVKNDSDDGVFRLSMICATGFEAGKLGELNIIVSSVSLINQIEINSVMVSDLNGVEIIGDLTLSNSLE
ncbi:MAG: hypothetical protein C0603_05225 [Denitrovibrio sp.]|nr:MAG: hypothetical protein C0603_05225 [Denitrovibrio sp.]